MILVATGGAIGALFRYSSTSIIKYIFPGYPLGTLLVNIIGSFLIGFLMSYTETKNFSEKKKLVDLKFYVTSNLKNFPKKAKHWLDVFPEVNLVSLQKKGWVS